MTDRVIIPLPGIGTLMLDRAVFDAALQAGTTLTVTPAATTIEPLLDADQAATQLGVTARWLEDAARSGIVPHYKLGRFIRFKVSEVGAHCRVEGAAIPGTTFATDSQSVLQKPRLVRQ